MTKIKPKFPYAHSNPAKDKRKFWILILLAVITGSWVYYLHDWISLEGPSESPKHSLDDAEGRIMSAQPSPHPFHVEPEILETVEDDKFLKTKAYYYLVHRALDMSQAEIEKKIDPQLNWKLFGNKKDTRSEPGKKSCRSGGAWWT